MTETRRGATAKNGTSAPARRVVSRTEAIFAARARVTADRKRGEATEKWIRDLADEQQTAAG